MALFVCAVTAGMCLWFFSAISGVLFLVQDDNLRRRRFGPVFRALPSVEMLSQTTRRMMVMGHLFIGLGLAMDFNGFLSHFSNNLLAELTLTIWLGWSVVVLFDWKMVGWRGRKSVAGALVGFTVISCLWLVQTFPKGEDPVLGEHRPGNARQVRVLIDEPTAVTAIVGDPTVSVD